MSARRTPVRWVVIVTLALLAATGCVTLPDHSGIKEGSGARVHDRPNLIRFTAPGPRPGAKKSQIVSGYLLAMLDYPQSPNDVRRFLTPHGRRTWLPDKQRVVYQGTTIGQGAGGVVNLTVREFGSINPRGSWTSATSDNDKYVKPLNLAMVDGQWRINNPPSGTFLDADYFNRYYHEYSLYYFDPTGTVLAPDPVYQLLGGLSRVATQLVRNLLRGPTAAMNDVVMGVVPAATDLAPGVTVSASGDADVHLTANVGDISQPDLTRFAAQLSWTLRQSRLGIDRFRVMVGEVPIPIPGYGRTVPTQGAFLDFSPSGGVDNLLAVSNQKLVSLAPTGKRAVIYQVHDPLRKIDAVSSVAVSVRGGRAAAVVGGTAVQVARITPGSVDQQAADWFDQGHHLLKPCWDWNHVLWLVDNVDGKAVVRVVTRRSHQNIVDAPGVSGHTVRAFAVSRDGTRFAAIISSDGGWELVIAMIQRGVRTRHDVSLVGATAVANVTYPLSNLTSLAWYTPTSLLVLAQTRGSEVQPYQIAIDGSRIQPLTGPPPALPESLTVSADPGDPPLIGTSDGNLYYRAPNEQWRLVPTNGVKVHRPSYAGA